MQQRLRHFAGQRELLLCYWTMADHLASGRPERGWHCQWRRRVSSPALLRHPSATCLWRVLHGRYSSIRLWYNGVQALSFTNLEIRSASSLSSIGGMFFSTFFGGDDSTWASPTDQYTYFRNIQMYAGFDASNGSGSAVSAASPRIAGASPVSLWTWSLVGSFAAALSLWAGVW